MALRRACLLSSPVSPAAACIDSSELQAFKATLRIEHGEEAVEVEVTGNMRVASLNLTFAIFDFAADSLQLSFGWNQDEGTDTCRAARPVPPRWPRCLRPDRCSSRRFRRNPVPSANAPSPREPKPPGLKVGARPAVRIMRG